MKPLRRRPNSLGRLLGVKRYPPGAPQPGTYNPFSPPWLGVRSPTAPLPEKPKPRPRRPRRHPEHPWPDPNNPSTKWKV